VTDVSGLGGGYAQSRPDPLPTVAALLAHARPGSPAARLLVLAGPPGVGKSAVAARLAELIPNAFWIDKDAAASGFILEAARLQGLGTEMAYGTPFYWQKLRPLEYAGSLALACANLVGTHQVLLVGGWGPELGVPSLWRGLREKIAPSSLLVVHLDAPPLEIWRQRLAARGSRADSPYFENFARALGSLPVWEEAIRISTQGPLHALVQRVLEALD
jgi:predicted kinase